MNSAALNQLIEAAEHALAVLRSLGERGYYPQELLPCDSNGKESPLFMGKQGMMFLINAIKEAKTAPQIEAWVAVHKTSAGTTYVVCVGTAEKYLTTHEYFIKGRADFEAAEWNHLFGLCDKPDIMEYDV